MPGGTGLNNKKSGTTRVIGNTATERGLLRLSSILIEVIKSQNGDNRLEEDVGDWRVSIRKISRKKQKGGSCT